MDESPQMKYFSKCDIMEIRSPWKYLIEIYVIRVFL